MDKESEKKCLKTGEILNHDEIENNKEYKLKKEIKCFKRF